MQFNAKWYISTHTLTWSVTGLEMKDTEEAEDFNSHAHVERDKMNSFQYQMQTISTHTLTWSVTVSLK